MHPEGLSARRGRAGRSHPPAATVANAAPAVALPLLVALVVSSLTLAACMGTASGMTKREYTQRASTICRDAGGEVEKVRADSSTSDAVSESIERVVAIERDAARRVHQLAFPKGDEAMLRHWLGLVDQALAQLQAAAGAARSGDPQDAAAANFRASALDHDADLLATRYGIDGCAVAR